jgi:hypothetical protein
MVDINKIRELNKALQEGLISQEEYDKIKANLMINQLDPTKENSQNLLTERLNNNSPVHTIPTNKTQYLIINNNNNNNNNILTDLITPIIVTARTLSSNLDQSIKAEKCKKVNKFQRNLVLVAIAGFSVIHSVNSQQFTSTTTTTYKSVTE